MDQSLVPYRPSFIIIMSSNSNSVESSPERQPLFRNVEKPRGDGGDAASYDSTTTRDDLRVATSTKTTMTPCRRLLLARRRRGDSPRRPSSNRVSSLNFEGLVNRHGIREIRRRFIFSGGDVGFSEPDDRRPPPDQLMLETRRPSLVFRLKKRLRHLLGYSGRTATRCILTVITGLGMGLIAISLVFFTGSITRWRAKIMHDSVHNWGRSLSKGMVFQTFLWTNLILALLSSVLCVAWVPGAAGSGIPEVKAYLNGARSMQKVAYWELFVVKIVGTVLSVSSALSVRQEGPLIHLGTVVGAGCTKIGANMSSLLILWNARRDEQKKGHHRGGGAG